jgi:hypothetical protein
MAKNNWDIDDPMNILSLKSLGKLNPTSEARKEKTPKQKRFIELMNQKPIAESYSEAAQQLLDIIKIIEKEFKNET